VLWIIAVVLSIPSGSFAEQLFKSSLHCKLSRSSAAPHAAVVTIPVAAAVPWVLARVVMTEPGCGLTVQCGCVLPGRHEPKRICYTIYI
jgi:hypothetical protein